jgi:hypothetical protein
MVAATRIVGKLAFRRASPLDECSLIHDAAAVWRAALAKRDATAAVIGAGDFIGSAIAKRIRDAGSTNSAKAIGFLDR